MDCRDIRRTPPPWWPANEAWPPARRSHAWRAGRRRFVRRLAFLFAALLLLSATGAAALISKLLRGSGIAATAPVGPLAILALVWLLALLATSMRRVAVPLGNIVEAANRVAGGDYAARIPEYGPPSVRVVANAFNTMAGRLEAQDQQRRNLMADIAHELRTPLSIIQGRVEGLLDGVYPRDDVRLAGLLDETRHLSRLVEDLGTLSSAEAGALDLRKELVDPAELIRDTAASLGAPAIRVDVPEELPLMELDPVRIREVLLNLLSNAVRHTPAEGVVSIEAAAQAKRLVIRVSDTGSGIAPEDLPHVFARFHKGRNSPGSGLG